MLCAWLKGFQRGCILGPKYQWESGKGWGHGTQWSEEPTGELSNLDIVKLKPGIQNCRPDYLIYNPCTIVDLISRWKLKSAFKIYSMWCSFYFLHSWVSINPPHHETFSHTSQLRGVEACEQMYICLRCFRLFQAQPLHLLLPCRKGHLTARRHFPLCYSIRSSLTVGRVRHGRRAAGLDAH